MLLLMLRQCAPRLHPPRRFLFRTWEKLTQLTRGCWVLGAGCPQVNEPFLWHKTVEKEFNSGLKRQGSAFQKVLELASTTLQR